MTDCVTMMCAAGTMENAQLIASSLVEHRAAACAQIFPIESYYRWEGNVHHEPELMIHIKTTERKTGDVQAIITQLHTYDVPEITVLPITGGSEQYLSWIRENVA